MGRKTLMRVSVAVALSAVLLVLLPTSALAAPAGARGVAAGSEHGGALVPSWIEWLWAWLDVRLGGGRGPIVSATGEEGPMIDPDGGRPAAASPGRPVTGARGPIVSATGDSGPMTDPDG